MTEPRAPAPALCSPYSNTLPPKLQSMKLLVTPPNSTIATGRHFMMHPKLRWSEVPPAGQRQLSHLRREGETSSWPFLLRTAWLCSFDGQPFPPMQNTFRNTVSGERQGCDREGPWGSQMKSLPKGPPRPGTPATLIFSPKLKPQDQKGRRLRRLAVNSRGMTEPSSKSKPTTCSGRDGQSLPKWLKMQ